MKEIQYVNKNIALKLKSNEDTYIQNMDDFIPEIRLYNDCLFYFRPELELIFTDSDVDIDAYSIRIKGTRSHYVRANISLFGEDYKTTIKRLKPNYAELDEVVQYKNSVVRRMGKYISDNRLTELTKGIKLDELAINNLFSTPFSKRNIFGFHMDYFKMSLKHNAIWLVDEPADMTITLNGGKNFIINDFVSVANDKIDEQNLKNSGI
jgi:uncharacterized protein YlzI (FlbEa/FlbD family)